MTMVTEKQKKYSVVIVAVVIVCIIAVAGIAALTFRDIGAGNSSLSSISSPGGPDLFPDKAYPVLAKGWSVEYHGTYKVIQINDPWGRQAENHTYLLVQRGEQVPEGYPDARVFFIPVESVITLTSTQLPYISDLNETTSIKGVNEINQVYDPELQNLAREGKITEVGSNTLSMNNNLQIEKMIELSPDVVFCSGPEIRNTMTSLNWWKRDSILQLMMNGWRAIRWHGQSGLNIIPCFTIRKKKPMRYLTV